jgi:hypothetical protein
MSYYSTKQGGAVFAVGTGNWVPALWDAPGQISRRLGVGPKWGTYEPVTRITMNVLGAFGPGPASSRHPSVESWRKFYAPSTTPRQSRDVS